MYRYLITRKNYDSSGNVLKTLNEIIVGAGLDKQLPNLKDQTYTKIDLDERQAERLATQPGLRIELMSVFAVEIKNSYKAKTCGPVTLFEVFADAGMADRFPDLDKNAKIAVLELTDNEYLTLFSRQEIDVHPGL